MYWKITEMTRQEAGAPAADASRFVLHRHQDAEGVHHDLRLEDGNCLLGFRIAGQALEAGCWATEKMPHPKEWLQQDRDAQRVLAGNYGWRDTEPNHRELLLHSGEATVTLHFERCAALPVESVRALATLAQEQHVALNGLPALVEDGLAARRNAMARFCGLSRELDGTGFDEQHWRDLFGGMTLHQIGEHLAAVEARYDRSHPPAPVSRPETLDHKEHAQENRAQRVREILNRTD